MKKIVCLMFLALLGLAAWPQIAEAGLLFRPRNNVVIVNAPSVSVQSFQRGGLFRRNDVVNINVGRSVLIRERDTFFVPAPVRFFNGPSRVIRLPDGRLIVVD